ncbi:MAG: 5-formyltetrahydrofolate cyclo-ligase [Victivallaceae bacterium]|nr:5-formyltetrahydrofolate cyclo-ligase [Victivallaceae bacterium]
MPLAYSQNGVATGVGDFASLPNQCVATGPERRSELEDSTCKSRLRRCFESRRKAIPMAERPALDRALARNVSTIPEYLSASCLGGFVPIGAEPDLGSLAAGKRLFLPRFNRNQLAYEMVEINNPERDLAIGRYGIPEPVSTLPAASEADLAGMFYLVPAVACDRCGVRLGRGGGYYDRILRGEATWAAVVYSCQLSDEKLPSEPHDVSMDYVVTDAEVVDCRRNPGKQKDKTGR